MPRQYRHAITPSHSEYPHQVSASWTALIGICRHSTDAASFLAVSQILEGVGVSAYLGAAQYIQNKQYLTVAGSILTAEARHSSVIRYINGATPFVEYDTPLNPVAVTSLAAPFFASCPNGSAPPFKPYPAANLTSTNANIGSNITVSLPASATNGTGQLYCTFLSGLSQAVAPFNNGSCTIPRTNVSTGAAYGLITRTPGFTNDSNVVGGPFVLEFSNGTTGRSSAAAGSGAVGDAAVKPNSASKTTVAGLSMAAVAMGFAVLV